MAGNRIEEDCGGKSRDEGKDVFARVPNLLSSDVCMSQSAIIFSQCKISALGQLEKSRILSAGCVGIYIVLK